MEFSQQTMFLQNILSKRFLELEWYIHTEELEECLNITPECIKKKKIKKKKSQLAVRFLFALCLPVSTFHFLLSAFFRFHSFFRFQASLFSLSAFSLLLAVVVFCEDQIVQNSLFFFFIKKFDSFRGNQSNQNPYGILSNGSLTRSQFIQEQMIYSAQKILQLFGQILT